MAARQHARESDAVSNPERLSAPHIGQKISHQARAVWQWWNCVSAHVAPGRTALRINLDETSVCLHQGRKKGVVFLKRMPRVNVPLSRRRTYMTYVALACDLPAAQRVLPQVIIGNLHTLPAKSMATLRAALPANVTLLRQRSAWNNNLLCSTIIRMIATALAPFADAYQPVIFFDAARCHLKWNVFAACARLGIWPILVPAKMTWLLQPLDTHVFASFKRRVQAAVLRARCSGDLEGNVLKQVLAALCEAIESVLQRSDWAHAFASNGFGNAQAGISARVLGALCLEAAPEISHARPSVEDLRVCFPKRARVVADKVLAAIGQNFKAPGAAPAALPLGAAPLPAAGPPTTRAASKAAAKAAALAAVPVGRRLTPMKRPAGSV